jgi:hypothetical protein
MGCTSKFRAKDGSSVSGYCTHYRGEPPWNPPPAPPAFWLDRDISIYFPSTSTLTSHNCFIHRRTTRTVCGPLSHALVAHVLESFSSRSNYSDPFHLEARAHAPSRTDRPPTTAVAKNPHPSGSVPFCTVLTTVASSRPTFFLAWPCRSRNFTYLLTPKSHLPL